MTKYSYQAINESGNTVSGDLEADSLDAKDMVCDFTVIKKAVAGCGGVLTVLVPWGTQKYASGTAQAVLDDSPPGARLIFSCGWHISMDGQDIYSRRLKLEEKLFGFVGRLFRVVDIDDQVEACRRVFASDTRWTVVQIRLMGLLKLKTVACGQSFMTSAQISRMGGMIRSE